MLLIPKPRNQPWPGCLSEFWEGSPEESLSYGRPSSPESVHPGPGTPDSPREAGSGYPGLKRVGA